MFYIFFESREMCWKLSGMVSDRLQETGAQNSSDIYWFWRGAHMSDISVYPETTFGVLIKA